MLDEKLDGSLFVYNGEGSVAFTSTPNFEKALVLIGGLGDSIMSLPYTHKLNEYCKAKKMALVIPQLRSMPNFNLTPIESDVEDLKNLIAKIEGSVVLLGHSTGCNDILLYLNEERNDGIKGVILQAPVSDTESVSRITVEQVLKDIADSEPGKGYIELENGEVWLKKRYQSLYLIHGEEDLFSSYLDDSEFSKWKQIRPILSVLSGKDEYCKKILSDKFVLMGDVHVIKNANHSLSDLNSQNEFLAAMDTFLNKIGFIN